jgi:anthranilate 1,2-dioxygenase small subunit
MTQELAPALAAWAIRAEIRELYDDYAFALDAFDLDRWASFFTQDCRYRIVSRENHEENLPLSTVECRGIAMVRDRVAGIRETSVFEPRTLRHLVGGVKVSEAPGGGWHGHANFAIFESMLERESHLLLVGRYIDHIVRDGEALKFRERICVYDNYRILTSLVYPV